MTRNLPWLQVRGPLFEKPYTVSRHPFDFGIQHVTHLYWISSNQYYLKKLCARIKGYSDGGSGEKKECEKECKS